MQHETRINEKPDAGDNNLRFTGTSDGNPRRISVSANSSLTGNAATGRFGGVLVDIQVSEALYEELATRPPSFIIVIDSDTRGNVSACTTKTAPEMAA